MDQTPASPRQVAAFLRARDGRALTVTDGTEQVLVPPEILSAAKDAAGLASIGAGHVVLGTRRDLTTTEAAEVIGVSRSRLRTMIAARELPSHRVGTHHRVRLVDALAARRRAEEYGTRAAGEAALARAGEHTRR